LTRTPIVGPRIESAIVPPQGVILDASGGCIAFNPDGSALAFIGHREGGRHLIWVRSMGSSSARPLNGTEDTWQFFWSPDGNSIAFIADEKLSRISAGGGSPEVISRGPISGGAWTPGGDVLFSMAQAIYRVTASGGKPDKLVELEGRTLTSPRMLPDGRRFLFTSIRGSNVPDALYVASLGGGEPSVVLEGVYSNSAYVAPDLILYVKDGDLRAQRVNAKTLEARGEPVRVADRVQYDPDSQAGLFSVSENGLIAYVSGEGAGKTELTWVSRDGKDVQTLGPPAMYYSPRLSHDEKRVVFDLSESQTASGDIWILDLQRNTSTRLTYDPANESSPVWTPDDKNVVFFSEKLGLGNLYQRSAAGIGNDEVVLEDQAFKAPTDVSPDGRWLAFNVKSTEDSASDVWLLDRESGQAKPFLTSPFEEGALQFSPDGKWVAYTSNESGTPEIYVLQFPESAGKWIVSRGGGDEATWGADGRQLYYISTAGKMMSVDVTPGESFDSGEPVALFDAKRRPSSYYRQYSVSNDGSRFLVNRMAGDDESHEVTFVQNWVAGVVN